MDRQTDRQLENIMLLLSTAGSRGIRILVLQHKKHVTLTYYTHTSVYTSVTGCWQTHTIEIVCKRVGDIDSNHFPVSFTCNTSQLTTEQTITTQLMYSYNVFPLHNKLNKLPHDSA